MIDQAVLKTREPAVMDHAAIYGNLPLFEDLAADTTGDLNKLKSLIPLLSMNHMSEAVGFVRLHRHFLVSPGEATIWRANGSQLTSEIAKPRANIDLPIAWLITDAGDVLPFEYISIDTLSSEVLISLSEIPDTRLFLHAMLLLKEANLNKSFGISSLPRVIIDRNNREKLCPMLEYSDREQNSSVLSYISEEELDGHLPTLWVSRGELLTILVSCTANSVKNC